MQSKGCDRQGRINPRRGRKSLAGLLPHTSNAAVPQLICSVAQQLITEEPDSLRWRRPEIWLLQSPARLARDPPCTPPACPGLVAPIDAHHPPLGCSPELSHARPRWGWMSIWHRCLCKRSLTGRFVPWPWDRSGMGGWDGGVGRGHPGCRSSQPARPWAAPAPRLPTEPSCSPGGALAPPIWGSGAGWPGDQAGR